MSSGVDLRAVVVAEMARIDEQIAALTRSYDDIVEAATASSARASLPIQLLDRLYEPCTKPASFGKLEGGRLS